MREVRKKMGKREK